MKWADINNMSKEELDENLARLRSELVNLRFKAHSGTLNQVHQIRASRKDIARIQTKLEEIKKSGHN